MKRYRRIVWSVLFVAAALVVFGGCAWQEEGDWRWKQWNPEWRSPWGPDR